jgi:hypothetical protein
MQTFKTSSTWLELADFNSGQIGPRSMSEIYLTHIFHPNRFSPVAIVQALRDMEKSDSISIGLSRGMEQAYDSDRLKAEMLAAIETDADRGMPAGGSFPTMQDFSDNAELLKLRWTKLLNRCIQYQLLLNTPSHLMVDSDYFHTVFVVKAGAMATVRGCEELDILDEVFTGELQDPPSEDGSDLCFPFSSYRDMLNRGMWNDYILYLEATEILYDCVPAHAFAAIEEDVTIALRDFETLRADQFAADLVNRLRIGKLPGHALADQSSVLLQKLTSCQNFDAFTSRLIGLLKSVASDLVVSSGHQSAEGLEDGVAGFLSFRYSVISLQQIADSRNRTCWNLAIALMVLATLDQNELVLPRHRVHALLTECFEVLRVWIALKWLCRENVDGRSNGVADGDGLRDSQDFARSIWETEPAKPSAVNLSLERTLIEVLMSDENREESVAGASMSLSLLGGAWDFLVRVGFAQGGLGEEDAPGDYSASTQRAFIKCAMILRKNKLFGALDRFVALMPNNVECAYLRACLFLEQDKPEMAGDFFRKTAGAFGEPDNPWLGKVFVFCVLTSRRRSRLHAIRSQ